MLSDERVMWQRLRNRKEWKFFGVLPKADRPLAVAWWCVLVLRGVLPAVFAIAMGVLVGAVQHGASLAGPLTSRRRRLRPAPGADADPSGGQRQPRRPHGRLALRPLTEACVRPPGMGHLEDPSSPATSRSRATSTSA